MTYTGYSSSADADTQTQQIPDADPSVPRARLELRYQGRAKDLEVYVFTSYHKYVYKLRYLRW